MPQDARTRRSGLSRLLSGSRPPPSSIGFPSMRNAQHDDRAVLAVKENAVIPNAHAPTRRNISSSHVRIRLRAIGVTLDFREDRIARGVVEALEVALRAGGKFEFHPIMLML